MVTQDEIHIDEQSHSFKDNRAPKCARCRNHGIVNSLKGHKHFCQWKNCNCPRCQVVVERQRITASRVASLRQQRKQTDSVQKRVGNILKFHDSMSPNSRNLINLDNVKYLRQMKQYGSLDSDNDSDRADSSGTPASLSPPSSPRSSIASGDFDSPKHSTKPTNTSYCTDPSCYECWKISQYMLKTNINKLRAMFPMLPTRTLESALARNRGQISAATQQLLLTIQKPVSYRDARPCTDPGCKECDLNNRDSTPIRRSPITFPMLSRKRGYEYQSRYSYDPLPKRPLIAEDYKFSRKSPVTEMERKSVSPVATSETAPSPTSRILMPPTLIKYCVDCNSQISIEDKFCGKCGYKQAVKIEKED